ncbi:MAG TPA: amidohydrolase family protein [Bryobacteraceae bacterium]|nr:amidohydrolase family protein [Bryobacteraceae bacterium]HPT24957.1 amidohydrolase family protein [Bryobacteraceae bacterium]
MRHAILALACCAPIGAQTLAVKGETVYTMAGPAIRDGVVIMRDGKIERVGTAVSTPIPSGMRTLTAKVVTPGLVDAHSTVGLSGILNQNHDQDQLETSAPMQPELRAIDAYNAKDALVGWLRSFGVTTIHTGHGPGSLISGQTMVVKTLGGNVEQDTVRAAAMVAASLGEDGRASGGKAPGTRAKMIAMLRGEFIKAKEYAAKAAKAEKGKEPARDLRLEALGKVLAGELPLLVTVNKANDILAALRLGTEFGLKLVLDGAAEAPLVLEEIKASGYPVFLHPTMARPSGDSGALSLETASKLKAAGIPFAIPSGFEGYVPKTRVILFEAALAAANGLTPEQALEAITIEPARLLGIANRVGSIESGKDGDLALYDGDPLEYTTHSIGVVIGGRLVSEARR